MTVSTTESVVEYISGGPAFPIPYRFLQDSDIQAVLVDQVGNAETLVLGTQYTLSGAGTQNGGTLTSAYAASVLATPGGSLTISRVMIPVQPTDLRNQGRFLAETHEFVFDRLTMLVQQGIALASRALLRPWGKNYYDAQGRQIKNLGAPTIPGDATNKKYVDDQNNAQDVRIDALSAGLPGTNYAFPWSTTTTQSTKTLTPGFTFASATLYLNGIAQPYGKAFAVVANQIVLAEAVPAGTEVYAILGQSVVPTPPTENAFDLYDYAALRAYTGPAQVIHITKKGIEGFFLIDQASQTSVDNTATKIVDAIGRQWNRLYVGAIKFDWFVDGDIVDFTYAWEKAIQLNNSGVSKGILLEAPSYTTKVTSALPEITAPMWITGLGTDRSIIFFAGVDGFVFNHSTLPAGSACGRLDNVTLTTNVASKTGLKLIGQATANSGMQFRLDKVELIPHSKAIGSEDSSEWAVAIQIGLPGGSKSNEVILDDVVISGSLSNTVYATRTSSIGVLVYSGTGFRYNLPKITLVGQGIVLDGQCEGAIITGGTIFGVDKGVVFRNLVSPSNNHVIEGTHFSPYTRGIAFEMPPASAPLTIGNFISGAFILERESGTTKTEDYVAIEMYAKYSEISETLVWSNSFGGTHKRIGVRVSNHNNKVAASFKNCDYPFDVVTYSADSDSGAVYADGSVISGSNLIQIDKSASTNLVYSNLKDPTVGSAALIQRAASLRIRHSAADKNLFRVNTGGVVLGDHLAGTVTIDVSSTATGTSGYDGRLLFTGGDSAGGTSGKGDVQISASAVRINAGTIRPETSGQASVGQPSFPFSAVYANTGTIQASDRDLKTLISNISDDVLDAFEAVQSKVYKYKDAVQEKGEEFARWHFGTIAQEIEEAFAARGLNAFDYGLLGYDEWPEQPEVWRTWEEERAEDGTVVVEAGQELVTAYMPAGHRYSVRYDEAHELRAAVQDRKINRLNEIVSEMSDAVIRLSSRVYKLENK
ncbi:tail fiber domain-containing protein [Pseudomonas sp. Marseille-P9655]|uniref:tail fiber domain-containing protein n=1 Tax=Pseudomonas sp. Marseille-P9655 TaxID=2866591 RepID=UPI001CE3E439|nr:tail fiber domain-containing protein [Pseudomonas sp. Marseille-P9655]